MSDDDDEEEDDAAEEVREVEIRVTPLTATTRIEKKSKSNEDDETALRWVVERNSWNKTRRRTNLF